MESGVFLGLDHGGSTTTALVYAPGDGVLARSSVRMPKRAPAPGHVEHDPRDFLRTSLEAAHQALKSADLSWRDVRSVGIANQGETSMAWSADGKEVFGPALSWEDRRTAAYCAALAPKGVDALVRQRTGVMLDPYFSASKFHWLTHEVPEAQRALRHGHLRLGGTDSFVIHQLTRGAVHATDAATASRTALLDIRKVAWDNDLLDAFGVERAGLPEIRPTCGPFGIVSHPEIPAQGIEITADAVDAHAALFAHACFDQTTAKATYGTGAFIEVNTGRTLIEPDGILPVFIAWQIDGKVDYTLEGGVFSVGSAIDWAVQMGLLPSSAETASLALNVSDTAGAFFIPSFTGLAAPHWVPTARAMMSGIGLDTTKAHLARALLDGIAFACAEVIVTLNKRLNNTLTLVKADGGPSGNAYLMQRQADLLGIPVQVSEEADMTALGAALMSAIGAGQLAAADVPHLSRRSRTYEPRVSGDEREFHWSQWRRGVQMVRELASQ